MERHKIFSPEQNFSRVETYFRAQLFQRINTDKIMKRAVIVSQNHLFNLYRKSRVAAMFRLSPFSIIQQSC
jgi:hypothetical protein